MTSQNRLAVVTGASSGIGQAVARRLLFEGWKVFGLDLRKSEEIDSYVCDVTNFDQVSDAIRQIETEAGPLLAAVTAAGFWRGTDPFHHHPASWQSLSAVHLGGTVNVAKSILPGMLQNGRGNIVFITTDLALNGNAEDAYYVTAKGAVLGLMRGLVREVHPRGIRINAVAPGATDTAILPPDSIWRTAEKLKTLPLPRLVDPAEISHAVALLCDPQIGFSGQIISPNAGQAR